MAPLGDDLQGGDTTAILRFAAVDEAIVDDKLSSTSFVTDSARLNRLMQRYGQDPDVMWAVERLEPRQCRIRRRDDEIRAALAHFPGPITVASKRLADALAAYLRTGWPVEQHHPVLPDSVTDRHRALHSILRLNDGRAMAYRRLMDICG